jgi:two-component system, chemotaxis family, protein-glutamate methylesterase/glutaminase
MRVLVVEDEITSALILERVVANGGHKVNVASDGLEALNALKQERFDAILTDVMMPGMDGIELIQKVRASIRPVPIIIVTTILASPKSRARALDAGADDYVIKPYDPKEVLNRLESCLSRVQVQRMSQPQIPVVRIEESALPLMKNPPPFVGLFITAGSGGPAAFGEILSGLAFPSRVACFIAQHAPPFIIETLVPVLQEKTEMKVNIAQQGIRAEADNIYLARGDLHLCVKPATIEIDLVRGPLEHGLRSAADPLFRSAAKAFGRYSIAVVLTGMGRDGCFGAIDVSGAGGIVIVQEPSTALNSAMPQNVIDLGIPLEVVSLAQMSVTISNHIDRLSSELAKL